MDESGASPAEAEAKEGQTQSNKSRVRDLFEWRSLSRPAQKYPKEFFKTLGAIALLLSIIFIFFQEWLAIIVTWAAVFLAYALSKIEPEEVSHKITTEGIVSMNHAYLWSELGPFWFTPSHTEGFTEKNDHVLLHLAHRNIFGQQIIVIAKDDQEKIKDILAEYLPFIEVPEKSYSDRLTAWFSKRFSLENPKSKTEATEEPQPSESAPQQ